MARTKLDAQALILRMNGPPCIQVEILKQGEGPTSFLRRRVLDGRVAQTTICLHPDDLEAPWPIFCHTIAHDLGHSEIQPVLDDLDRIASWLPKRAGWWLRRSKQQGRLWVAYLEEVLELITGHRQTIEVEADRRSLRYLATVCLGLEVLEDSYQLEISRYQKHPRLLRWLIVRRIRQRLAILKGQSSMNPLEALGI